MLCGDNNDGRYYRGGRVLLYFFYCFLLFLCFFFFRSKFRNNRTQDCGRLIGVNNLCVQYLLLLIIIPLHYLSRVYMS